MKSVLVLLTGAAALLAAPAYAQTTVTPSPAPGASTAAAPAPAPAPPAPDLVIAYNVGVQSDYVFRGVSQTNNNPSAFAGIDLTYKSLFYAGAWTSNLNFKPFGDTHTNEEVDLYGGIRPVVNDFNFDFGVQYYGYLNQPNNFPAVDYTEVYAKVTHAFGPATLGASVYYSPKFTGGTGHATYTELNAAYTINPKWSISGLVGHQAIEKASDYTTWNAGVTYALTDHIGIDLRYYDTDSHSFGEVYKSRAVVALKATF
ncbi:MAG: TorF family putative porin [Pseudomonadota bacterium]|jgi:uncharacterized protein (TIGR02001 family)|nr:TorF family putative porin [Pseudomonadota bacterium]